MEIKHTNYISTNPIFRVLLNNFLHKVRNILVSIGSIELLGLDAGCGEGHMLGYLQSQGVLGRLIAVDISQRNISLAKKKFPFFDYKVGNLCRLPFDDDTFDYIISTEVFEHLPSPKLAILELKRTAKPSGHLLISVPFEPFFHWGNLVRGKYWQRGGFTPDHCNFWRKKQFLSFLAPLVNVEIEYSFKTFPWLLYGCRFK